MQIFQLISGACIAGNVMIHLKVERQARLYLQNSSMHSDPKWCAALILS